MESGREPTPINGTRCTARSSRTGKPCKRRPIDGGTVCATHGGRAPQVKAAAAQRVVERQAIAEFTKLGIPLHVNPLEALLGQVYEAAGNVEFLRRKVQELDCLWYQFERGVKPTEGEPDENGRPQRDWISIIEIKPDIMVQLYNQERDRLAHFAELCVKAGVAERQVKIAEVQATMFVACVSAALSDPRSGLTAPQREKVRAVVIEQLRQLGSASAEPLRPRS